MTRADWEAVTPKCGHCRALMVCDFADEAWRCSGCAAWRSWGAVAIWLEELIAA